ncbi:MAG: hypothetical protein V1922_00835 [bacterium]
MPDEQSTPHLTEWKYKPVRHDTTKREELHGDSNLLLGKVLFQLILRYVHADITEIPPEGEGFILADCSNLYIAQVHPNKDDTQVIVSDGSIVHVGNWHSSMGIVRGHSALVMDHLDCDAQPSEKPTIILQDDEGCVVFPKDTPEHAAVVVGMTYKNERPINFETGKNTYRLQADIPSIDDIAEPTAINTPKNKGTMCLCAGKDAPLVIVRTKNEKGENGAVIFKKTQIEGEPDKLTAVTVFFNLGNMSNYASYLRSGIGEETKLMEEFAATVDPDKRKGLDLHWINASPQIDHATHVYYGKNITSPAAAAQVAVDNASFATQLIKAVGSVVYTNSHGYVAKAERSSSSNPTVVAKGTSVVHIVEGNDKMAVEDSAMVYCGGTGRIASSSPDAIVYLDPQSTIECTSPSAAYHLVEPIATLPTHISPYLTQYEGRAY